MECNIPYKSVKQHMPSTEQLKKKKNRGNIHPKTNKNLTQSLLLIKTITISQK